MTTYNNAPGVTDNQVRDALIVAAREGEKLRQEIYKDPSLATSSRIFAMIQARAEKEVRDAGSDHPERTELVIIAGIIRDLQNILVEEMSEILR